MLRTYIDFYKFMYFIFYKFIILTKKHNNILQKLRYAYNILHILYYKYLLYTYYTIIILHIL